VPPALTHSRNRHTVTLASKLSSLPHRSAIATGTVNGMSTFERLGSEPVFEVEMEDYGDLTAIAAPATGEYSTRGPESGPAMQHDISTAV
jgi:hypothetical protein